MVSLPTEQDKDGDVSYNRSMLRQSTQQTNVKSWLAMSLHVNNGSTSAEDLPQQEIEVEADAEEGGLGYAPPTYGTSNDRQFRSANDKLRDQLLGKQNQSNPRRKFPNRKADMLSASKPRPQTKKTKPAESDDEAEGRTSSTIRRSDRTATTTDSGGKAEISSDQSRSKSNPKKRPGSYLDEILAQRTKKKKKSKS